MIQSTTNYEIFKKNKFNRDIIQANLSNIVASIRLHNMLELRPMLVDENMSVIDGQHRLEAAKILCVPIYYQIHKDAKAADILLLNNNQSGWRPAAYLNYHIQHGNENYIKFKAFIEKYNLTISQGVSLLESHRGNRNFMNGRFIFPETEKVNDSLDKLRKLEVVVDFIRRKLPSKSAFLSSLRFRECLLDFVSLAEYDQEHFLKRLEKKLEWVRSCSSYSSYYIMLKEIYNHHNQHHKME